MSCTTSVATQYRCLLKKWRRGKSGQRETVPEGWFSASFSNIAAIGLELLHLVEYRLRLRYLRIAFLVLRVSSSVAVELAGAITKFHYGPFGQFVFDLLLVRLLSEDPRAVLVCFADLGPLSRGISEAYFQSVFHFSPDVESRWPLEGLF